VKQLGLDRYATLDSPIHRWEARSKLVGLLVLIFAFSAIRDWRLVPFMYGVTAILFWSSRLPFGYLLSRLKLPGYFIAFLVVLLPFISGSTELLRLGPLALRQEGLLNALIIASRFICIITVTLVIFGTAPFLTSIKALRALGLPDILADMILLTYRYLFEMADTLAAMRTAIRLRGFDRSQFSRKNLNTVASLIGSLLVRSYEQSEQVYRAMVLRGYGTGKLTSDSFVTRAKDVVLCCAALGAATALMFGQFWLFLSHS
jgi:cobalt/nickel transport system permease protein